MDRFRAFIRARHLAYRTKKTYCNWVREFIRFHNKRHPESMGAEEVNAWLSHLADNFASGASAAPWIFELATNPAQTPESHPAR
nr:site-specific integrase [uncultured Marinobacter sp.]